MPREVTEDDPVEFFRALQARKMCRSGDSRPLCAGNSGCETVGDAVDVGDVLVARHDQSRNLHLGEAFRLGWIETQHADVFVTLLLPERLFLHLADELALSRIDVIQTPTRTGKPHAQICVDGSVEISALERLLFGRKKDVTSFDHS